MAAKSSWRRNLTDKNRLLYRSSRGRGHTLSAWLKVYYLSMEHSSGYFLSLFCCFGILPLLFSTLSMVLPCLMSSTSTLRTMIHLSLIALDTGWHSNYSDYIRDENFKVWRSRRLVDQLILLSSWLNIISHLNSPLHTFANMQTCIWEYFATRLGTCQ
jgi:hypothetical protein